jgi:hypothetical protein
VTVDRRIAIASLSLGPLLMMFGYAATMLSPAGISDPMLLGLVIFPTVLLLLAAALAALLHRDATGWISMAIGTATGAVVTVIVVGGGISLLAWMLSDPG